VDRQNLAILLRWLIGVRIGGQDAIQPRIGELPARQVGEGQALAHGDGCFGIRQQSAQGGEDGVAEILELFAQGKSIGAAGVADGILKPLLSFKPLIDGAAMQPGSGGGFRDGGALGQGIRYARLAGREHRWCRRFGNGGWHILPEP